MVVKATSKRAKYSKRPDLTRLVMIVAPGLCNAISVFLEAWLQPHDFLGRNGLERAGRRGIDHAARVFLHFETVQEHLRNAVADDHAAVAPQQAAPTRPERCRHLGALLERADVGGVRMNGTADEAKAEVS